MNRLIRTRGVATLRGLFAIVMLATLLTTVVQVATMKHAGADGTITTTIGCPYGGTLSGATCTVTATPTTTQVPSCPNGGTYDTTTQMCDVPATVVPPNVNTYPTYSCPNGGVLISGPECQITNAPYAATATENTGFYCPSGYGLNVGNLTCSRVAKNGTIVYAGVEYGVDGGAFGYSYSCPNGGTLSGTTCGSTTSLYQPTSGVTFTYTCPGSSTNTSVNASCPVAAYSYTPTITTTTTCAPSATLSGGTCTQTYTAQYIASEVVCGTTYTGVGITPSAAALAINPSGSGACVVAGSTPPYNANTSTYVAGCSYEYFSTISQTDANNLAKVAAQTLCNGATVATSGLASGSYTDPCTGKTYTATATATEPGGGPAAAGTAAYGAAQAVATTDAQEAALAADPTCQAITTGSYSSSPVAGDVPVTASEQRSGNGSATGTYTQCSVNGGETTVTNSFVATYPGPGGTDPTGTATVYSVNDPTDIAAAQLLANSEAAAAAVAEAVSLANAAAQQALSSAETLAAQQCAAFGQSNTASGSTSGSSSSGLVTTGGVASGATLTAVACPSATECMAVGYNQNGQSIWTVGTLSNNIWSWTTTSTITPDATGVGYLLAVACLSTTTCIATGGSAGGSTGLGVYSIGTYSGSAWTWTNEQDLVGDANGGGVLFTIQCVSSTLCIAGGDDHRWRGVATTATLSGGTWTFATETMVGSDANGGGRLLAMSCPSATQCVAVGDDDPGQGTFTSGTLSNGVWTWSADQEITPDASGYGTLRGVACPSTTLCIAVGYDNNQFGVESIGVRANGTWTWTQQSQVLVGATAMGDFLGISCSSVALCSTVGYNGLNQGQAVGVQVSVGTVQFVDQITITSPVTGGGRLYAIASTGLGAYVAVGYSNVGIVIGS